METIKIELNDYDYSNGKEIAMFNQKGFLVELEHFNIECDIYINQENVVSNSSYLNPSESYIDDENIIIENFKVIYDEGEETDQQVLDTIYKEFVSSIYVC